MIEMLAAGVSGYLLKNSAGVELQMAISAVRQGDIYLSPKIAGVVVGKALNERMDDRESSVHAAHAARA